MSTAQWEAMARAGTEYRLRNPKPTPLPARTVWVSASSHRSRARLRQIVRDAGPEHGVWPEHGWPRGSYYEVPATYADALRNVKGLRVLRGKPTGGRIFRRLTSADTGGPVLGGNTG